MRELVEMGHAYRWRLEELERELAVSRSRFSDLVQRHYKAEAMVDYERLSFVIQMPRNVVLGEKLARVVADEIFKGLMKRESNYRIPFFWDLRLQK